MNAYFMKVTPEERENILDKHKEVYDGYVTNYIKPSTQQLYVQDFANDKNGITVDNKGNVTKYKNMNINESECTECGIKEEKMCSECGMNEEVCECGMKTETSELNYGEFDYTEEVDLELEQIEKLKNEIDEISEMFKKFKRYN